MRATRSAFLFDMDGVLVDSNPLHCVAWGRYLAGCGLNVPDFERRMLGKRNDEIVRDFWGEHLSPEDVDAHGAAKERVYRELMRPELDARVLPGVREFLREYAHVDAAVGSNAEPANVDFVLDGAGLRPYFSAVVHGHQVTRPKPDPEVYLRAAAALGRTPHECIVFEDSPAGIAAAQAAGAAVVAVVTDDNLPDGVALVIRDFHDRRLREWLCASGCF